LDNDEIRDFYLALTDPEKQVFLAILSNELTIYGRGFSIDLTGDQLTRAFNGLNELQHQISQHIAGIGLKHNRYPDEVLWAILQEKAAFYGLTAHLGHCLAFARSRNFWATPKASASHGEPPANAAAIN